MLMAIVVPVAMQGMGVANRAAVLGQRKAAAMRVADRLLNETAISGPATQTSSNGTIAEGELSFGWSMESRTWSEDAMLQLTVRVTFTVQGTEHSVTASTLLDPGAGNEPLDTGTTAEPGA